MNVARIESWYSHLRVMVQPGFSALLSYARAFPIVLAVWALAGIGLSLVALEMLRRSAVSWIVQSRTAHRTNPRPGSRWYS